MSAHFKNRARLSRLGASTQRHLYTFPETEVERPISPAGLVITHHDVHTDDSFKNLHTLVVQPGLPGTWIRTAHDKAAELVASRPDCTVMIVLSPGLQTRSAIYQLLEEDYQKVPKRIKPFFEHTFSLDLFKQQLAAILQCLPEVEFIPTQGIQTIHAIGHSYGAAALLYALDHLSKHEFHLPDSATFLAPFVKIALDTQNEDDELSIVNRFPGDTRVDVPGHDYQKILLEELLKTCGDHYSTTKTVDWLAQHRRAFGSAFLEGIKGIRKRIGDGLLVQATFGGNDTAVGFDHAAFLQRCFGPENVFRAQVLEQDGHDLESLRFEDLLRKVRS